jgi:hypothetical protein
MLESGEKKSEILIPKFETNPNYQNPNLPDGGANSVPKGRKSGFFLIFRKM